MFTDLQLAGMGVVVQGLIALKWFVSQIERVQGLLRMQDPVRGTQERITLLQGQREVHARIGM